MRVLVSVFLLAFLPSAGGAEQVVVLGDSLSKEYEFEFRFDGFSNPDTVRNWSEILHRDRKDFFDTGSRIDLNVLFVDIFFRHRYNWAVPGSSLAQIASFLRGEIEFIEFYTGNDPTAFEAVISAIALFVTRDDFDLADLDAQIRTSAERVVLLAGGNDLDEVYRELYTADPAFDAAAWVRAFLTDAQFIMDWVLTRNPSIEFVVVALPHVGITPNVKASHPTDPVKTARVTSVVRHLNCGLAALATERGIGFADAFDATLPLLQAGPLCLHGIPFTNDIPPAGTDPGSIDFVWLNGTASDGFHPNTNAQALIANEIVRAFNETYHTGIPLLTATEILQGWLGKDPEISFAQWLDCYGLAGADANDDRDRDGLPAGIEFGVGADPTRADPWQVEFSSGTDATGPFIELAYPLRLPGSAEVTVRDESSTDLESWQPLPGEPAPALDRRYHSRLPVGPEDRFLRLKATIP